jgi:uncharacterized protein (DUF433 family)
LSIARGVPMLSGEMKEARHERITSTPDVAHGKPVIAGTRITVELVLEKLAAGESVEDLLAAHPRLSRESIQAALRFAADVMRNEVVYPIGSSAA